MSNNSPWHATLLCVADVGAVADMDIEAGAQSGRWIGPASASLAPASNASGGGVDLPASSSTNTGAPP